MNQTVFNKIKAAKAAKEKQEKEAAALAAASKERYVAFAKDECDRFEALIATLEPKIKASVVEYELDDEGKILETQMLSGLLKSTTCSDEYITACYNEVISRGYKNLTISLQSDKIWFDI